MVVVPVLVVYGAKESETCVPAPRTLPNASISEEVRGGVAVQLESRPWLTTAPAALCFAWMIPWAMDGGLSLNPNSMNVTFLAIGLLLAGGLIQHMRLAERRRPHVLASSSSFPVWRYSRTVGRWWRGWPDGFSDAESAGLLSVSTFISAGLFNLFVPSGGGQWAVQGPIVMSAAVAADIDPGRVVLSLCWGDQWTNLFQPFWALPLLTTGPRWRYSDIQLFWCCSGFIFAIGSLVG